MKKIFTTLLLSMLWQISSAQFVITTEGVRSNEDNTKSYIVITNPGSDVETNYSRIKEFITKEYASAKDVLSEANGNVITVFGVHEFATKVNVKCIGELWYKLEFSCREDRVKIECSIQKMEARVWNGTPASIYLTPGGGFGTGSIFDKKGKVKLEEYKSSVEEFFNKKVVSTAKQYIAGTAEEDW